MFSSSSSNSSADTDSSIDGPTTPTSAYSFEQLCVPLYQDMTNFARRLAGGNHVRAADVVQTAYLKALDAWPRWTPDGDITISVRAWLYRIVANTYMKDYRAVRIGQRRETLLTTEPVLATFGRTGDDGRDIIDASYGDEVSEALASLSDDHRELIDAYYLRDLGCDEIAIDLGIEKGTVFSRLARARAALESALSVFAENNYGIRRTRPRPSARASESVGGEGLRKPTKRPKAKAARVPSIVCELDRKQL